jgi:translation initiation factor IF-1
LPNRTVREATTDDNMQKYKFELLLQDMHYYLNKEEGWIRFDSITISANDHVAIYLRTESPQISRGEKQDTSLNLWTLKTEAPIDSASADTSRFYLM